MPEYRLLVRLHSDPMKSVSVSLSDSSEAFIVAQRYNGIAELWEDNRHVCTISRAHDGDFWVIKNSDEV